eukprot:TRINITY_DN991_c0_g2_i1.p1 TRINITY_DN991_c0_g2~~TRINITY_DN991_c0_g2_i1.p1  ORF type:complete len:696 (+),score=126.80 TRINITY_DN991_c0_g2_i1:114-2201(+)
MAGLSFRPRPVEPHLPIPIRIGADDDEDEAVSITRMVPKLATGMEENEEKEAHIRHAIRRPLAVNTIPTPRVVIVKGYDEAPIIHPFTRLPNSYICCQGYTRARMWTSYEDDSISIVEYDADSEDERWLKSFNSSKNTLPLEKFEFVFDRLEKENERYCQIYDSVTLMPCPKTERMYNVKMNILQSVYNYWTQKRLKTGHQFLRRLEKPTDPNDPCPYKAFRVPVDDRQKKKGRRNDKSTYTRMLNLRQEFERARTLFELMVKREKIKRDHIALSNQIFQHQAAQASKLARIKGERKATNTQTLTVKESRSMEITPLTTVTVAPHDENLEPVPSLLVMPSEPVTVEQVIADPLLADLFDFVKFKAGFYPTHRPTQKFDTSTWKSTVKKRPMLLLFRKPPGGGRPFYGRLRVGRLGRVFIDRMHKLEEGPAAVIESQKGNVSASTAGEEPTVPASDFLRYPAAIKYDQNSSPPTQSELEFRNALLGDSEPYFEEFQLFPELADASELTFHDDRHTSNFPQSSMRIAPHDDMSLDLGDAFTTTSLETPLASSQQRINLVRGESAGLSMSDVQSSFLGKVLPTTDSTSKLATQNVEGDNSSSTDRMEVDTSNQHYKGSRTNLSLTERLHPLDGISLSHGTGLFAAEAPKESPVSRVVEVKSEPGKTAITDIDSLVPNSQDSKPSHTIPSTPMSFVLST